MMKMDPSLRGEVLNFIIDGRRAIMDDTPERGVRAIEGFMKRLGGRYIEPGLKAELASVLKECKQRVKDAAEGGGEEGGGDGEDEDDELDLVDE